MATITGLLHCSRCSFFSGDRIIYIKHFFQAHCHESTFAYTCELPSCSHLFKYGSPYSSYLTHCNRKHPKWRDQLVTRPPLQNISNHMHIENYHEILPEDDNIDQDDDNVDLDYDENVINTSTENAEEENLALVSAKFLLTLKENFRLTQVALDYTIESVIDIVKLTSHEIELSVKTKLQSLYPSEIPQTFSDCFVTVNPFEKLKTEYQQTQFYKEHLGLIVSSKY